jgi:hypothetical protein
MRGAGGVSVSEIRIMRIRPTRKEWAFLFLGEIFRAGKRRDKSTATKKEADAERKCRLRLKAPASEGGCYKSRGSVKRFSGNYFYWASAREREWQ